MLELRILTGLHRGAALPLEGDAVHIGSGPENDIVLLDPGMPARVGILERAPNADWQYRSYAPAQTSDSSTARVDAPLDGAVIVAGARWFAGPVLLGCDEEGSPWPADPAQPQTPLSASRRLSPRRKLSTAVVATTALGGLVAAFVMLAERTESTQTASLRPGSSPAMGTVPSAESGRFPEPSVPRKSTLPSIRVAKGTLYPSEAVAARPPFAIRSASAGPYGFVVTDDDRILVPGSRWKAFTLVRVEPGRAVFSGPHAAELRW